MKENVLVNFIMCRVIGNCSAKLSCKDAKNKYVKYCMKRLQYSGYNEQKTCKILKKVIELTREEERSI